MEENTVRGKDVWNAALSQVPQTVGSMLIADGVAGVGIGLGLTSSIALGVLSSAETMFLVAPIPLILFGLVGIGIGAVGHAISKYVDNKTMPNTPKPNIERSDFFRKIEPLAWLFNPLTLHLAGPVTAVCSFFNKINASIKSRSNEK